MFASFRVFRAVRLQKAFLSDLLESSREMAIFGKRWNPNHFDMKLRTIFAAVLLTALAVQATAQDVVHLTRFDDENAAVPQATRKTHRVVFIGDSITEGWGNLHSEFFDNDRRVERGISGEVSAQMLLRFRKDVIDLAPRTVVINAGTNDIALNLGAYDEDYTFGNIVSMVELAKAHRIKVVLTSVLPAARFGWRPAVTDGPEKIQALNARIRAYAAANRIPYVDYYSALVDADGRTLDPAYSKDGVHPTREGYLVMAPLVEKAL